MWGFLVSGKIPETSLPAVLFVGWNKYLQLVHPAFILPRRLSKQLDLSVKCFGNLEQITDYDYAKAETSFASEVFFFLSLPLSHSLSVQISLLGLQLSKIQKLLAKVHHNLVRRKVGTG